MRTTPVDALARPSHVSVHAAYCTGGKSATAPTDSSPSTGVGYSASGWRVRPPTGLEPPLGIDEAKDVAEAFLKDHGVRT
ncbi:hypothetical protein, partial [Longivirga aurantiaca]|uniref:hypothetical protein n=1 Tax=Longivirga aurantiaca TaxID=1837743 RepID=UPI0036D976D7